MDLKQQQKAIEVVRSVGVNNLGFFLAIQIAKVLEDPNFDRRQFLADCGFKGTSELDKFRQHLWAK